MDRESILRKTVDFVKETLTRAEGGHDWWHTYRVWRMSQHIAKTVNADIFIVELGALLHDIADVKFHDGDENAGPHKAREFLDAIGAEENVISLIEMIIRHVSFKGAGHIQSFSSPELEIIQDADRLDAMGAIGIARTFNFGGYKNREIYNPAIPPELDQSEKAYRTSRAPTINHFYEKLLLLKDRMHTTTGKKLAESRHSFMEAFLDQFFKEWNGFA
jgi:uncharacterized protein